MGTMQVHYAKIKENLGLEEALADSSEDEKEDYMQKMKEQKSEFASKIREKKL